MTVDLKLGQPKDEITRERRCEEARALLSCYYLSVGLSVLGFDKLQTLPYTDNLRKAGEYLSENGDLSTEADWLEAVQPDAHC